MENLMTILALTSMVITGISICLSLAFYLMWRDEKKMHDDARKDQRFQFDKWHEATSYALKLEKKLLKRK
jgi:hypothetical protein